MLLLSLLTLEHVAKYQRSVLAYEKGEMFGSNRWIERVSSTSVEYFKPVRETDESQDGSSIRSEIDNILKYSALSYSVSEIATNYNPMRVYLLRSTVDCLYNILKMLRHLPLSE